MSYTFRNVDEINCPTGGREPYTFTVWMSDLDCPSLMRQQLSTNYHGTLMQYGCTITNINSWGATRLTALHSFVLRQWSSRDIAF